MPTIKIMYESLRAAIHHLDTDADRGEWLRGFMVGFSGGHHSANNAFAPFNLGISFGHAHLNMSNDPLEEIEEREAIARATPPTMHYKPSILDWIIEGHPRIHIRGQDHFLWQGFLDKWSMDVGWKMVWQEMYDDLLRSIKDPRHKIFAQDAITWMSTRYTPEVPCLNR